MHLHISCFWDSCLISSHLSYLNFGQSYQFFCLRYVSHVCRVSFLRYDKLQNFQLLCNMNFVTLLCQKMCLKSISWIRNDLNFTEIMSTFLYIPIKVRLLWKKVNLITLNSVSNRMLTYCIIFAQWDAQGGGVKPTILIASYWM